MRRWVCTLVSHYNFCYHKTGFSSIALITYGLHKRKKKRYYHRVRYFTYRNIHAYDLTSLTTKIWIDWIWADLNAVQKAYTIRAPVKQWLVGTGAASFLAHAFSTEVFRTTIICKNTSAMEPTFCSWWLWYRHMIEVMLKALNYISYKLIKEKRHAFVS